MDGLVSDFAYNDELLAVGVNQYLCANSIGYYFGPLWRDKAVQTVSVNAPLARLPVGTLQLSREDIVVRTRDFLARPEEALDFAIWKLNCPVYQGSRPKIDGGMDWTTIKIANQNQDER